MATPTTAGPEAVPPSDGERSRTREPNGSCLYDGTHETQEFTAAELEEVRRALEEATAAAERERGARRFVVVTRVRSQNYSTSTRMQPPYGIMLHHTGGRSVEGDLATLTKPASDPRKSVSSNDYITKDGTIYELVEHPKRAWHAGGGSWNGITDGNSHFWGIETQNRGDNRDPYPTAQIDAIVWRCRERRAALGINTLQMLTRHRDFSSQGKIDPSDNFPYAEVRRRVFASTDPTDDGVGPVPDDPGDEPTYPEGLEKYNVAGFGRRQSLIATAAAGALRSVGVSAGAVHNRTSLKRAADKSAVAPLRQGPRLMVLGTQAADALTEAGHQLGSEPLSDLFGAVGAGATPQARLRDLLRLTIPLLDVVATVEGKPGAAVRRRFRTALVAFDDTFAELMPDGDGVPQRFGADSRLLTETRAPRQLIETAILARPHGDYDENDIRVIVGLYYEIAPTVGADPFLLCVQAIHETRFFDSEWASREHCNPAGIGVTGEPGVGISFPDWRAGTRAHTGRICAYALTDDQATTDQRALIAEALAWRALPASYRGIAPTLGGLTRRWAAAGDYDALIAAHANRILGIEA